jgi:hypothetical protein
MRGIRSTNKFEKAFIWFYNGFDDWQLEWVGDKNLPYDAIGKTPKGDECVIEMKFRKTYYETKLLEKKRFDNLMKLPKKVIKIYFVSDPKGSYWFWLNKLQELNIFNKRFPETTHWSGSKIKKEVYLLDESQASLVNRSDEKENINPFAKKKSKKK